VLQLQQFVTYAVIVAYYNSVVIVASAVYILLCMHILQLCHFAVYATYELCPKNPGGYMHMQQKNP